MWLFLDANILFSAAYRENSAAEWLFRFARAGCCEALTSPFALEEARRNLALKRPDRGEALEAWLPLLSFAPEPGPAAIHAAANHGLPDKDAPILAAAIAAGADGLVTGDRRHFGSLYGRRIEGVQVLTLAAALDILASEP